MVIHQGRRAGRMFKSEGAARIKAQKQENGLFRNCNYYTLVLLESGLRFNGKWQAEILNE